MRLYIRSVARDTRASVLDAEDATPAPPVFAPAPVIDAYGDKFCLTQKDPDWPDHNDHLIAGDDIYMLDFDESRMLDLDQPPDKLATLLMQDWRKDLADPDRRAASFADFMQHNFRNDVQDVASIRGFINVASGIKLNNNNVIGHHDGIRFRGSVYLKLAALEGRGLAYRQSVFDRIAARHSHPEESPYEDLDEDGLRAVLAQIGNGSPVDEKAVRPIQRRLNQNLKLTIYRGLVLNVRPEDFTAGSIASLRRLTGYPFEEIRAGTRFPYTETVSRGWTHDPAIALAAAVPTINGVGMVLECVAGYKDILFDNFYIEKALRKKTREPDWDGEIRIAHEVIANAMNSVPVNIMRLIPSSERVEALFKGRPMRSSG